MFIEAKDDGSDGDYWSYKSCKTPVKSSPPRNQHTTFYRPDALPVAQPTVSKHWKENITFHGLIYSKLTWGLPTLCLTNNSSWLPWGRVAMPLIRTPMPVPRGTRMSPVWILLELRMMEVVVTTAAIRPAKLQSVKMSSPTNQHPDFFTGRMPFLSPNQQCRSTGGKTKISG